MHSALTHKLCFVRTYNEYIKKIKDKDNIFQFEIIKAEEKDEDNLFIFSDGIEGVHIEGTEIYFHRKYDKFKITRINSTSVNVSASIKFSTRCFPFGVRLLDSQQNDFRIYTYKNINGELYKNDLTKLGVPRDTGFVIEYTGSTTESIVTANFIIDDSVGSLLTDNVLIGATAERDGFAKSSLYLLSIDSTGAAKWLLSDLTVIPAQRAAMPVANHREYSITKFITNEHLINTEGSVSNTLLQSSGSIIPIEKMVETAKSDKEKQKAINYASWHVTKAIDNASVLTSLVGCKDKLDGDSGLITSIKNLSK